MYIRALMLFLGLGCSSSIEAFNCYFTLVKDSCWTNYTVNVDVTDAVTSKVLITMALPPGTGWVRQDYNCQPGQKFLYKARFSPVFWSNEKDKVYSARNYWSLPAEIKPKETAWEIPVCYSADFSEIPLPPDAKGNCQCDFSVVPALKPQ